MMNQEECKNRCELTDEELEQVSGGITNYDVKCISCGFNHGSHTLICNESLQTKLLNKYNSEGCPRCGALNSMERYNWEWH